MSAKKETKKVTPKKVTPKKSSTKGGIKEEKKAGQGIGRQAAMSKTSGL